MVSLSLKSHSTKIMEYCSSKRRVKEQVKVQLGGVCKNSKVGGESRFGLGWSKFSSSGYILGNGDFSKVKMFNVGHV